MANLFFDVLPAEIRQEIYCIRLSDALMRNYYRRVAQKVALTQLVFKIQAAKVLDEFPSLIIKQLKFCPIVSTAKLC